MTKKTIYLDHNATTPIREEVRQAIEPYLNDRFGNPSSIHQYGRIAKSGLEQAREQVANLIGAKPESIYFTSGGTEADNLAILGAARFAKKKQKKAHLITTAIEHEAVLASCHYLKENEGFELTIVPVDQTGRVHVEEIEKAIRPDTILVSVMMTNNEVGTCQPIAEISEVLRGKDILFHTDAVQGVGFFALDVKKIPVDLLSLSGHKIGALKGIGALYVKPTVKLYPLLHGGAQEMFLRSGTENIVGTVSLGAAAELTQKEKAVRFERMKKMRDQLWEGIQSRIEGGILNGHETERMPNTLNICFEGAEAEAILLALDLEGIAVSGGAACASGSVEPSHVLQAMGVSDELAKNSVRFSFGHNNTDEDVRQILELLPPIISRIRLAHSSA